MVRLSGFYVRHLLDQRIGGLATPSRRVREFFLGTFSACLMHSIRAAMGGRAIRSLYFRMNKREAWGERPGAATSI